MSFMRFFDFTKHGEPPSEIFALRPMHKKPNMDDVRKATEEVMRAVYMDHDSAVRMFTEKFDKVRLDSFEVTSEELNKAASRMSKTAQGAFKQAYRNIWKFHEAQLARDRQNEVETMPGVKCFAEFRAIEKVGLYIPGGTAPLPSTVLMLAIPARLAGCKEVYMATPPNRAGRVDDAILYAARLCEVDKVFKIGGAQAIGALAFGTETVPRVSKIFGPGNQYVTAAKSIAARFNGIAVDMPAGPTELLVIADENARADFVASDMLSQAEHGDDSQVILAVTSKQKADEVQAAVKRQLDTLPRKGIARRALGNGHVALFDNLEKAVEFANIYAPEHLILNVEDPNALVPQIMNAGSVFLGPYSCEAAGDYASGPNHTLPTYGHARAYSGISVASFQKRITFQEVSREGAANLAPTVTRLAELEGLEGHKRAMEMRLEDER